MKEPRKHAHVRVSSVTKNFALAEKGAGPVSLTDALRSGKQETVTRQIHALRGVSFEIHEGTRVGVIGRNGAGKTTLLSMLAGITDASSGSIEITGDVHAILTIGAVLRDEATGRENIRLDGAVHGKSNLDIEARVDEIVAFSELGEFIDRPVRTYSSGMKARLAFSMSAFVEPDVLIIDETLSVGDAFFAGKAMNRMKEVAAQGRIVIMVSHALASIVDMCDRCLWLEDGLLVMDGDPKAVTDAYQNAVAQNDEAELAAKFGSGDDIVKNGGAGVLELLSIIQSGEEISAIARAFQPLTISVGGQIGPDNHHPDVELQITRVDGRRILRRCLSESGSNLPASGSFNLEIVLDPLLLGADLYRFAVLLLNGDTAIDSTHRVLDIIDEEGQFGGRPLLFYTPVIAGRPLGVIPK